MFPSILCLVIITIFNPSGRSKNSFEDAHRWWYTNRKLSTRLCTKKKQKSLPLANTVGTVSHGQPSNSQLRAKKASAGKRLILSQASAAKILIKKSDKSATGSAAAGENAESWVAAQR